MTTYNNFNETNAAGGGGSVLMTGGAASSEPERLQRELSQQRHCVQNEENPFETPSSTPHARKGCAGKSPERAAGRGPTQNPF